MQFHNWDSETRALFHAIRRYRKACDQYIAGKSSPERSLVRLESTFETLQDALNSPVVTRRLGVVIEAGAARSSSPLLEATDDVSAEDLALEIAFSKAFGLQPKQVEKAIDGDIDTLVERIVSPDDVIARLDDFHDTLIEKTEAARSIGQRIEKKKRKRNIAQAVTSVLFGTCCGVANTYAIPGMPLAATSYAVTLTAFHAAARDLVGEKPKD